MKAGNSGEGNADRHSNSTGGSYDTDLESNSGPEPTEGGKLNFNVIHIENAYWQAFLKGVREATRALGYDENISVNDGSTRKMVTQVESALQSEDGVWVRPAGNAGVPEITDAAARIGTPLVTSWATAMWLTPLDVGPEWTQFNTPSSFQEGVAAGKLLAHDLGEEGNYVRIDGLKGDLVTEARGKGLQTTLDEYDGVQQLGNAVQGHYTRQGGRKAMTEYISQFGDDIDAIYTANDAMTLGALNVADERGLELEAVVSVDGIPSFLEKIASRDEVSGTISPNPVWQGGWNTVQLYDKIQGEEFHPPQRMIFTSDPVLVGDTSNYADLDVSFKIMDALKFKETVFEGDSTPYDWKKMSRAESGGDWDPQNSVRPIRKADFSKELLWSESEKPEGYELPDVYDDTAQFDRYEEWYEDHFENDPLAE